MQTQPNIIDAGDVLIVGAGLAGLFTALKLSHRQVTVMTAEKPKREVPAPGRREELPPRLVRMTMLICMWQIR